MKTSEVTDQLYAYYLTIYRANGNTGQLTRATVATGINMIELEEIVAITDNTQLKVAFFSLELKHDEQTDEENFRCLTVLLDMAGISHD